MLGVAHGAATGLAGLQTKAQLSRLREMLPEVLATNAFWRQRFGGVPPVRDAEGYRNLPLTSNRDLSADLLANPPFGSNLTYPLTEYTKFHQTSGTIGKPLIVLDTNRSWEWWCDCWNTVLETCGVRNGDRAFFAFSFAPFIGFWSAHAAVERRGLLAVSGGGAGTARRVRLLTDTECTVLFSTPTYALRMAAEARDQGIDLAKSPVRCAILAGEPGGSVPAIRRQIAEAYGAQVYDHAGASEIGAYGLPCPDGRGVFVNESEFIAEVLKVGDDKPVKEGERGELVLTNLGRWACPVIRYRTGDLVRPRRVARGLLLEGGLLGRVDQMMLLRGVNLHPTAIEEAVRRKAGPAEFRITVTRSSGMDEAEVEVEAGTPECDAIADSIRNAFGVRVSVHSVPSESLPRWQAKAQRFLDLRE